MDENRDLQILSPTQKTWGERQKGGETNTLIFSKPPPNSVSPVSSFSTVAKKHKVMPC